MPAGDRDRCVICHRETPYPASTHIDFRDYYVEGCGQLCEECFNEMSGLPRDKIAKKFSDGSGGDKHNS